MNDRFKFRAWDKTLKSYWRHGNFDLERGQNDKDLIIEQCTGLKDKNGRLIYEGDIVAHDHQVKRLVPVDDKQPLEVAHGRDEENGLPLVYRTQKTIKYKGIVSHDNILGTIIDLPHNFHWWKNEENGILPSVEVIGNIHENKELLKGVK